MRSPATLRSMPARRAPHSRYSVRVQSAGSGVFGDHEPTWVSCAPSRTSIPSRRISPLARLALPRRVGSCSGLSGVPLSSAYRGSAPRSSAWRPDVVQSRSLTASASSIVMLARLAARSGVAPSLRAIGAFATARLVVAAGSSRGALLVGALVFMALRASSRCARAAAAAGRS